MALTPNEEADIARVAELVKRLDEAQGGHEVSLCLLSLLLPYQLRLSVLAERPSLDVRLAGLGREPEPEIVLLSEDFMELLTALRDALLRS